MAVSARDDFCLWRSVGCEVDKFQFQEIADHLDAVTAAIRGRKKSNTLAMGPVRAGDPSPTNLALFSTPG
jgi:hypothetical protein